MNTARKDALKNSKIYYNQTILKTDVIYDKICRYKTATKLI